MRVSVVVDVVSDIDEEVALSPPIINGRCKRSDG